jgi:hypothetical protein
MKNSTPINALVVVLSLLAAAAIPGCDSGPETFHVTHFHNPSWTVDGKYVVAGYQDFSSEGGTANTPGPVRNMYIREVGTGISTAILHPGFHMTDRFFLDPANHIAAATSGGLLFVSLDGTVKGTLGGAQFPVVPSLLDFTPAGGACLWAGSANGGTGRLVVGRALYTIAPWEPGTVQVLKDTAITSTLLDIVHTSDASWAMRLSDGTIREYSFTGALLSQFSVRPLTHESGSAWQTRMHYVDNGRDRKIYVIEDSGLVSLNLVTKVSSLLVKGRLPNVAFSKAAASNFMLYETQTGDIWLSTRDTNSPLYRLAYQNIMPSISSDGRRATAVARLNQHTDTLNVLSVP